MLGWGRYRRRSARVFLIDGADRILLLRSATNGEDSATRYCWLTPGGGVNRWESLRRAAARELHEEVGLRVSWRSLGAPVAMTGGFADLGWARGTFRDDFFVHRVSEHEVDTSGMEQLERNHHSGHRWWSLAELAETEETIYPYELLPLLTDLLAGRLPAQVVRLPWHH